jgi:hypothetical protein
VTFSKKFGNAEGNECESDRVYSVGEKQEVDERQFW